MVRDANGCDATAEFLIQEPADLDPYNLDFDDIQCFGEFTTVRLDPASFSGGNGGDFTYSCLLYTSPSPRDRTRSRMPSSA